MNNACPRLTLLDNDQIQQIHHYALRILSVTGVRVDSPFLVDLLEKTRGVQVAGRVV